MVPFGPKETHIGPLRPHDAFIRSFAPACVRGGCIISLKSTAGSDCYHTDQSLCPRLLRPRLACSQKNIPESSAWWKEQAKDLFALTEEHELGMMSSMVTITHNDLVLEMLANIRRGPFSLPTETEQIEYLLTRVRTDRPKSDFENYGMEHVLSY